METRGRRAPRATGPIGPLAGPVKPIEIPAAEEDEATEAWKPAEALTEAAEPAGIGIDLADSAAPSAPVPSSGMLAKLTKSASPEEFAPFGRDAFAALVQSQAALARGLEALSVEMAGLALSGIDTAARAATKMLGVKTLSDAIDVNTGFACSSLDALVGGSAKLSELGVKFATEASRPFLTQLGQSWMKASRLGF